MCFNGAMAINTPTKTRNLTFADPTRPEGSKAVIRIDAYRWGRSNPAYWTYSLEFDPGPGTTEYLRSTGNLTKTEATDVLVAHGFTRTGAIGTLGRVRTLDRSTNC